jgi:hypothetical protein
MGRKVAGAADVVAKALCRHVRPLLSSQVQCVLATVQQDHKPATALMAYGLSPCLRTIYLATPVAARKAKNMIQRPDVSLLWDNRTGNLSDHGDGLLVTADGTSALAPDRDAAAAFFLQRNHNMATFLATEGVGLFAVSVREYEIVQGYERPQRWEPSDPTFAFLNSEGHGT